MGVIVVAEESGSALSGNPFYRDPLVSVILTAVDAEDRVMRAIRSILAQTWRQLELLVVDDASADGTLALLQGINDPRLRVWRTPRPAGRAFCERFALQHARGAFVAFQDAREWSHPTRLERQARHLVAHPQVGICGGHRVLVDARHKALAPPAAGPRSAMFRRPLLDELDPFASDHDDAFERRVRTVWDDSFVAVLPDVLILGSAPGAPPRVGEAPRRERGEGGVVRVRTAGDRLTASLATIASRSEALREVVGAILPQVDALRVYLNDHERVPDFLRHDKVTAFLGREHAGDIADNGKFFRVEDVRGYHFTLDDDLAYPPDYIDTLRARIDRYAGQAVVGVHGIDIEYDRFERYYDPRSRRVHGYRHPLGQDTAVHLLGTGTVGYHTATLGVCFDELNQRRMADILFGLQASRAGVPLVCIERGRDWLVDHEVPDDSRIFARQRDDDSVQSRLVTETRLVARRPTGHYLTGPAPEDAPTGRGAEGADIPWRQARETVHLLGALVRESAGAVGVESLADLSYRSDAIQLGPFGSEEPARALAAHLRDTFGLDATVVGDDASVPARFVVRATGLGDTVAGVALKDELAGRHTRGERYLRLGPFPSPLIAQAVVHGLSTHLDDLGWALSPDRGPEACYRLQGFGYTSDVEGTYAQVHVVTRATASPSPGSPEDPALLPWGPEDLAAEWRRLVDEGRAALAAGDPHTAHRRLGAARELRPLEPADMHRLACGLIRAGHPAAGVEVLLDVAPGFPDVEALVDPLAEGLRGSPPRFEEEAWTALLARRPDALPARRRLAEHHLRNGRPDEALRLFDAPPPTRDWALARARIALRAGHLPEAVRSVARAAWLRAGPRPLPEPRAALPEDQGPRLGDPADVPAKRAPVAPAGAVQIGEEPALPAPSVVARQEPPTEASEVLLEGLRGEVAELRSRLDQREAMLAEGRHEVEASRAAAAAAESAARDHREARLQASSDLEVAQALLRHARRGDVADEAVRLRGLKVACIVDEFTHASFRHECNALQLTPQRWRAEIEAFEPEMLFVESAWRGKDELWGNKVGHKSQEVRDIVAWCRDRRVPTVFWNKEDPVHFETFLGTAALFDAVFTTDVDCIHRYKRALGHDRVYLLPFACQPRVTNPVETHARKDAFCFAGAYYVRYPERTRDLRTFVDTLSALRPVEIYDRNHGKDDPNYRFPEAYQPYIVGHLPFDQIDLAYKGYRYAINLNSIKQSQSMFARRVFELLASNTIVVSNFSRGMRLLFGDLTVTTDSGRHLARRLEALTVDEADLRRFRLAGLRKVMAEHTYQDRFAYVASKVTGREVPRLLPRVVVVGHARSAGDLARLAESFARQTYPHKRLLVVARRALDARGLPPYARVETVRTLGATPIGERVEPDEWIAGMAPADHYGPNYLLDLALATRYSDARAFGKVTHHAWDSGRVRLVDPDRQYRPTPAVAARCALVHGSLAGERPLATWASELEHARIEAEGALAVDEFHYCRDGAGAPAQDLRALEDLPDLHHGLDLRDLVARAERIAPEAVAEDDTPTLTGRQLAAHFKPPNNRGFLCRVVGEAWSVESSLGDGQHTYLYAATHLRPTDLGYDGRVRLHLEATPGLSLHMVVLFLSAAKERIGSVVQPANRNGEAEIPDGTAWLCFGLRLYGSGASQIRRLVLGHRTLQPAVVVGQAEHLVLTNHYPSYDDLYRNAFVHTRVRAYRERGVRVDVFRLREGEPLGHHEFEDVDVLTGSSEALERLLAEGQHRHVLVHFLDEAMWRVLARHLDRVAVTVWVHGAEIQPWHRRDYNFRTEAERAAALARSDLRMAFWRGLLREMPPNLTLVFVSRHFAEEVMEDLGFRLPDDRYAIVHNPIDTRRFAFHEKEPALRRKVLSIRPFASRTYANDLSVRAILALRDAPWFDEVEFRLVGDGALFDEVVAPVAHLPNVRLDRRFLTQDEIAALHREHGIFLCPSRMDSQGVSRDEAMASGLVPVTTRVAAIPEFVDETCGLLAEPEDAEGLARGIARLVEDPDLFVTLSRAAARRVRRQSAADRTIERELALLRTTP